MDENRAQEEIYSKVVRAGKRTYFFDVRATRAEDYYLTITESKKFFNEDGSSHYKKHKIFLYKEDFEKFKDAFSEVVGYIVDAEGEAVISNHESNGKEETTTETTEKEKDFTDVNFDDI
ncbi:MAG: PUR family DNA/RNA-binding protein [Flavobacteriales bacterium]|nr:PUR family DNA/RNA-binding protein [Flavobacteriales bacterium]